jgi:enolase
VAALRAGTPLSGYLGGLHANLLRVPMMNIVAGGARAVPAVVVIASNMKSSGRV